MEIKVVLFSSDHFDRDELEKLTEEDLLDLAYVAWNVDDNAYVYESLEKFKEDVNNRIVYVDNCYIYFITM